jgi:hypothetical protein
MAAIAAGRAAAMAAMAIVLVLAHSEVAAQEQTASSAASIRRAGEAFKARLINAISTGNRREVAGMFKYPTRVTVPTLPYPVAVKDAAAMVQMHDLFFTPEMRCAIEQSRMPEQGEPRPKYALLVAEGVVSLADGRILAERTPAGFKVTRMTILGEGGAPPGKPRNVVFRWNVGETQYAGRLAGDGVDAYVVSARKGDLLQARIERFPGRALTLRITEQRTGRVLRGAPTEYARTWAAPVPETGEYRVEIVRRAAYCDPAVTYLLTLAVRR